MEFGIGGLKKGDRGGGRGRREWEGVKGILG